MKIIGLIGGMSYVSTLDYYRIINEKASLLLGEHQTPKLILVSVNFHQIASAMHNSQWQIIENILIDATAILEKSAVDFSIICCNSAHKVFEKIIQKTSMPFIHVLTAIGRHLEKKRIKKVAIIGTKFVMSDSFYRDYLTEKFNVTTLLPNLKQQEIIHNAIYSELCYGVISNHFKEEISNIINELKAKGAEGVILGCTELRLAISPEKCTISILDSTLIHASYALDYALA